ncbi:hypothetical protein D1823_15030 [Ruegeria sp. AD91A]|uniref:hypothetical protein n=1 Tax=Ruegeria sp. AD91A TaxID=2293862 RepID=UPI000E4955C7|nr:hypothetical protein [Ruegeria sp. AD91A]AXT27763.1 hypothetical protein D1823_15030 [Ruegeria sp. AD91A]
MFVVRNYVTMCGTVACALGIGYLMQNGSPAQPAGAQQGVDVASASEQSSVLSGLDGIVQTSATVSDAIPGNATPVSRAVPAPSRPSDCSISARAVAVPGAMARLSLKAPCHKNERVEVHHSGLTVSQKTNESGALDMTIPALSEYAIFLISFENEAGTVATTHVTDIAEYDRVALQWQGDTELQIHALEFGASYGSSGHVWDDASAKGAGEVLRLGQAGLGDTKNVQVYSFPAGTTDRSGTIDLTVEAEVTEANCGHTLNVQALELLSDRRLRSRDMSLTLPDCSQAGEFLVLNNLLSDLTIAAK